MYHNIMLWCVFFQIIDELNEELPVKYPMADVLSIELCDVDKRKLTLFCADNRKWSFIFPLNVS